MKRYLLTVALVLSAIACVQSVQAQVKAHRVLFALTLPDEADWQVALNNVHNLESGVAPEAVELEIVVYGPGIALLNKGGPDAADIQKLVSAHVHLVACGYAMKKQSLEGSDLVSGIKVVSAGIVEVMRKQEAGWVYVKAGR